jgi:hypothetical protein
MVNSNRAISIFDNGSQQATPSTVAPNTRWIFAFRCVRIVKTNPDQACWTLRKKGGCFMDSAGFFKCSNSRGSCSGCCRTRSGEIPLIPFMESLSWIIARRLSGFPATKFRVLQFTQNFCDHTRRDELFLPSAFGREWSSRRLVAESTRSD